MDHLEVDLLVIGFGKGGKTLAAEIGLRGSRVAMVEQSAAMYGGACINVACVPTKALVHDAGIRPPGEDPSAWYARAIERKDTLTSTMRAANYRMLDRHDTVTVVTGRARFAGPHAVEVTAGPDRLRISAEAIVINTGSVPIIPDIPGAADSPRAFTSTSMIDRRDLPDRLAIIGGGYIGLEFASMYAGFGSDVTLLHSGPAILRHEDEDVAEAVRSVLTDAGVRIITDARATAIDDGDAATTVAYTTAGTAERLEADAILFAVGRRPETDDLGLEHAGIELTERGAVRVDEHLRTTASGIYAVGDVNGGPQFTHISLDDYRIVLDQLVGDGRRSTHDRVGVPRTLFISPPLSTVGVTERDARAAKADVLVAAKAVADIATMPRPKIARNPRGLIKVVVDGATDQILGASLFCIDSQEVINLVALAMRSGVPTSDLRDGIWMHPSTTEGLNEVLTTLPPRRQPARTRAARR